MSNEFNPTQQKGVVYWPIDTGDSTKLMLKSGALVMQIDNDADQPEWPILDHLVKAPPKRNGRPYLAGFALTHDKDRCLGLCRVAQAGRHSGARELETTLMR